MFYQANRSTNSIEVPVTGDIRIFEIIFYYRRNKYSYEKLECLRFVNTLKFDIKVNRYWILYELLMRIELSIPSSLHAKACFCCGRKLVTSSSKSRRFQMKVDVIILKPDFHVMADHIQFLDNMETKFWSYGNNCFALMRSKYVAK